jgi:hypothetical protein
MEPKIKGGYILQPRIIQESDISIASPCIRETWAYLLREANSKENKYNGNIIKRGQLFRSYEDIREGTKWFVGWRKETYNENATKSAMKFLRDTQRITTEKQLGGVLITICNYDFYQNPKNYEATTEATIEETIEQPIENHPPPVYNKNNKNNKNEKEGIIKSIGENSYFLDQIIETFVQEYGDYKIINQEREREYAGMILKEYKVNYPNSDEEKTIDDLRIVFRACVNIDDKWKRENMSLSLIANKYNELKAYFKNEKSNGKQTGISQEGLTRVVAKHFGINT